MSLPITRVSSYVLRGGSFDSVPPTLAVAFDNLQKESANDVFTDAAKNLCDSGIWDSMDIDEIIVRLHRSNTACQRLTRACLHGRLFASFTSWSPFVL